MLIVLHFHIQHLDREKLKGVFKSNLCNLITVKGDGGVVGGEGVGVGGGGAQWMLDLHLCTKEHSEYTTVEIHRAGGGEVTYLLYSERKPQRRHTQVNVLNKHCGICSSI